MRNLAVARVTIRPVEPCDIEAVQHVLIATWHATYDATLGRSKVEEVAAAWHSPAALEHQLRATGSTFLLAEDCSGVLGCGFARAPGFGCAQIGQLYVLPRAQGRGIGTRLLSALLEAYPRSTLFRLEVEPRNARAISFYERAGFKVVGGGSDCAGCGSGIAHVVMEKPL